MPPTTSSRDSTATERHGDEGGAVSTSGGSGSSSSSGGGGGGIAVRIGENSDGNSYNNDSFSTSRSSLPPSIRSPNSNSTSLSGSSSGSSRLPAVDTREHYKGYSFVFATDANYPREIVHGNGTGNGISYLTPTPLKRTDISPSVRLPLFFTAFRWNNVHGRACAVSDQLSSAGWVAADFRCLVLRLVTPGKSLSTN